MSLLFRSFTKYFEESDSYYTLIIVLSLSVKLHRMDSEIIEHKHLS